MINLSKMGYAKISGGIYPINSEVGSCIEKFVPPPRIVTVRDRITGYEQPGQQCIKCKKLEILPILGRMAKM